MKKILSFLLFLNLSVLYAHANGFDFLKEKDSGRFSLGTRNAFSLFNDLPGESAGLGIGGQFRLQFSDRVNTEWYMDYLTSGIGKNGIRNDYHIGWSVMYYLGSKTGFDHFFKPYLIAGHCFDYTEVFARTNKDYHKDRLSMATQAGLGTHFNISPNFDFSLSTQYMLHFGKELEAYDREGEFVIERDEFSKPGGHLLTVLSVNYKFAKLW